LALPTNLAGTIQENPTTSISNEQSGSISRDQMQEFLNTVMQAMKESREQTAALQEEFRKQTAAQEEARKQTAEESKKQILALQEGSEKQAAKLTSAVESLRSKIREENNRLASSLTAKFEAAHHKIREDFYAKLTSEIATVSTKIDSVQKGTKSEISKLSSTIDDVYVSITEKVETAVTHTKEEMAQYVNDKFKAVAGDVRQVKRNADEISKVQATLGELQNKVASVGPNKQPSADSGNTIVRIGTADQPLASTSSSVGANMIPSTTSVSASSNIACNDSTSVISQNTNSGVCTNVNVTSEECNRSVDLNELTLPLFTDSSKQVPLHFIRDLDLYFRL
jgi:hypothetical protein